MCIRDRTYMANELATTRLNLLRELVPRVTRVAYLTGSQQFELEQENTSVLRAAAAAKSKIPAISPGVAFVSDGGLMSYAAGRAMYRKVAVDYVGKILGGAN